MLMQTSHDGDGVKTPACDKITFENADLEVLASGSDKLQSAISWLACGLILGHIDTSNVRTRPSFDSICIFFPEDLTADHSK